MEESQAELKPMVRSILFALGRRATEREFRSEYFNTEGQSIDRLLRQFQMTFWQLMKTMPDVCRVSKVCDETFIERISTEESAHMDHLTVRNDRRKKKKIAPLRVSYRPASRPINYRIGTSSAQQSFLTSRPYSAQQKPQAVTKPPTNRLAPPKTTRLPPHALMPKTVFKNDTVDPSKACDMQQRPTKINGMLSHKDPSKSRTDGLPPHMTFPKTVYKTDAEVVAQEKTPAQTKVLPPHMTMPKVVYKPDAEVLTQEKASALMKILPPHQPMAKLIYKTDAEVVAQEKMPALTKVLPPHMSWPKIVYKKPEVDETSPQRRKEAGDTTEKFSPHRSMGTIVNEPASGTVSVERAPLTTATLAALDLKTPNESSHVTKVNSDSSSSSVWSDWSASEASSPVPTEVARKFEMLRAQHKSQAPKASTELQTASKDENESKDPHVAINTSPSVVPGASQVVPDRIFIKELLASITHIDYNLDNYATKRMEIPYPTMKHIKFIKFFNIEIIEVSSPSKFTFQFNCIELENMSNSMMSHYKTLGESRHLTLRKALPSMSAAAFDGGSWHRVELLCIFERDAFCLFVDNGQRKYLNLSELRYLEKSFIKPTRKTGKGSLFGVQQKDERWWNHQAIEAFKKKSLGVKLLATIKGHHEGIYSMTLIDDVRKQSRINDFMINEGHAEAIPTDASVYATLV